MRRTQWQAIAIAGVVTVSGLSNMTGAGAAKVVKPATITSTTSSTTTTVSTTSVNMPRSLGKVSTNAWATSQPTAKGKGLGAVTYVDGEVYVGYGDWDANTGPTHVTSWSPQTGTWTDHLTADTEAIEGFRQIGGTTYVPLIDPHTDTADFAASSSWRSVAVGSNGAAFEHVFDMAETADGMWMVGSKRDTGGALAMRSIDGGVTWTESLLVPGWYNRFYTAAVLDGVLHLQDQDTAYRFVDGTWVTAPLMGRTSELHNAVSVPGAVGMVDYYRSAAYLYRFDGTTYTQSTETDWLSLTKSGDTVYALRSGSVVSSKDLVTWTTVSRKAPTGAISLAVGGGYLWFGTAAGELWAAPLA